MPGPGDRTATRRPAAPGEVSTKKAFADFLRFFTQRRTTEQTFMVDSLTELRDVRADAHYVIDEGTGLQQQERPVPR